jgi:hypothetical protein
MLKLTMQLAKLTLDSRMQQLGGNEVAAYTNDGTERNSMKNLKKFPSIIEDTPKASKPTHKT